jgi:hypothetical protein
LTLNTIFAVISVYGELSSGIKNLISSIAASIEVTIVEIEGAELEVGFGVRARYAFVEITCWPAVYRSSDQGSSSSVSQKINGDSLELLRPSMVTTAGIVVIKCIRWAAYRSRERKEWRDKVSVGLTL